jgi:radical SAM protein with 4Fe4S-binding SPASM domain
MGQGKSNFHAISQADAASSMNGLFRHWVDNKLYKKIEIENFQAFEDNVTALSRSYMCRKQRCGAGREQLAFDTNGNIFPCDYVVGEDFFALGNVSNVNAYGVEHSVLMDDLHAKVHPDELSECKECPVFAFCGNCMASSYFNNGTLNGRRGSCHTDYKAINDIIFEILSNGEYRDHVLSR